MVKVAPHTRSTSERTSSREGVNKVAKRNNNARDAKRGEIVETRGGALVSRPEMAAPRRPNVFRPAER
jgi:hypothetical protein